MLYSFSNNNQGGGPGQVFKCRKTQEDMGKDLNMQYKNYREIVFTLKDNLKQKLMTSGS